MFLKVGRWEEDKLKILDFGKIYYPFETVKTSYLICDFLLKNIPQLVCWTSHFPEVITRN